MDIQTIADAIRDVPDFPKSGIVFKDICPVLQNAALFRGVIDLMTERCRQLPIDLVAGIDARGFIFAGALARELGRGLTLVRKAGKLPWQTVAASYELEYGTNTVEMHRDAVAAGRNVLLVDDVLATGGTAAAGIELIETLGGNVAAVLFFTELGFLNGRQRLGRHRVESLVRFD